ncbi:MAG: recombinase zinc beta ribbon domain-containing protein [Nitrospirae bacterium]|nr:recombinase zinc beta ribbon domain-containing protein [Nitrospirota bacterium]
MLFVNNMTKTGYRQDDNQFLLRGLLYCKNCNSAMTPSFSISKEKKYCYYRCTVDNDASKRQCEIGSVNAREIEALVVDELKFLAKDPRIVSGVIDNATKEHKGKVRNLYVKKKMLTDNLAQVDKKAKNLLSVLGGEGKKNSRTNYIMKEIDDLETQSEQLKNEINSVGFAINSIENKIVSADIIKENFKTFEDVYDKLTQDEKYDLMHLLIKKISYSANVRKDTKHNKLSGKIKMDLWELPPIDPSKLNPAKGFAESNAWLPRRDSNPRQGG